MRTEKQGRYTRVTIEPGEYFSCGNATVISTLLGSCVAACLYDPIRKIIGMNHFMLSSQRYSQELPIYESEAGRYGINAMELLINDMLDKGAKRSSLRAKVFGGASIFRKSESADNFLCVGQVNSRFIKAFLINEGIPLEAENLMGEYGRVIHFSNGDFSVYQRKIGLNKSHQLAMRDRECWQRAIKIQETTLPEIELWL
ncbi:MAG TPA: chemotaxis protein CheD [Desulfuromonadales bacterium]|nr:chemotaxis protein CheD [Desulfuromonadales bacterium]